MSTKLTLENFDGRYEVEVQGDGFTGDQFVEELVRPVMLAAGYHPKTVAEALGEDE